MRWLQRLLRRGYLTIKCTFGNEACLKEVAQLMPRELGDQVLVKVKDRRTLIIRVKREDLLDAIKEMVRANYGYVDEVSWSSNPI